MPFLLISKVIPKARFAARLASLCVVAALLALISKEAIGQMTVISNTNFAADCYHNSVMAIQFQSSGLDDIEPCDTAIEHGALVKQDLVATYVNRGVIYVAMEKFNLAASDYEKALSLDADLPATYLNRGNLWFVAEHFDRAIADYSKAMELQLGELHIAYLNRGMAKESMGSLLAAKSDYHLSLELRPEWALAEAKLARVERKLSQ